MIPLSEYLLCIRAIVSVAYHDLSTWTDRYTPVVIRGTEMQIDTIDVLRHRMERLLEWVDGAIEEHCHKEKTS